MGRGRAFWEKLAREVEAGATQTETANKYGVSQGALQRWCRLLRNEAGSATLLPVRVVSAPVRRIDLTVGQNRISFEEGTDPHYVVQLARALAQ